MKRVVLTAFAASLALHALLAVTLVFFLGRTPVSDEFVRLDLTRIDLSFAETVEETSAAAVRVRSVPVDAASLPRPREEEIPPPEATDAPHPLCAPAFDPKVVRVAVLPTPAEPIESLPTPADPVESLPTPADPVESLPTPADPVESLPTPAETIERLPTSAEPIERLPTSREETERQSAPRQARVNAPPKPCCGIRPEYPRVSRLRGEHGDVALELDVAADGAVSDVRVLGSSGFPLLDESAVKAVRAARFTPARSGGRFVGATVRLTLAFRLK